MLKQLSSPKVVVLLFLCLYLLCPVSVAVNPVVKAQSRITWSRTYGGTQGDIASSIIQTSDNGLAIGGFTWSFGTDGADFWLIKTDIYSNVQWNRTFNGISDEWLRTVIQTSDGGYALAGMTSNGGANGRFYLLKTDSEGNQMWDKVIEMGYHAEGRCLIQTSDGGYVVVGEYGANSWDFLVVKIDSQGNLLWNKTYGESGDNRCYSVVETSEGGLAIGGWISEDGGNNDINFWLVKTDAEGTVQWTGSYGGATWDLLGDLIQTSDGGYALAGHTGMTPETTVDRYDFFLVKTDAAGNMQWSKTYGGGSQDYFESLIQTSDGGFALLGASESFGAGNSDFWLVKTDPIGTKLWDRTYGGQYREDGMDVIQTSDGGYAMCGFTEAFSLNVRSDFLVIKTDSQGICDSYPILSPQPTSTAPSLTPNPTSTQPKPPSRTTIDTTPSTLKFGQMVELEGSVIDQTTGNPAIQVLVRLEAVDPNGNIMSIGTAQTSQSGAYRYFWTPPISGTYRIMATFDGNQNLSASEANVYLTVNSNPETQAPTSTPNPTTTIQPSTTSTLSFTQTPNPTSISQSNPQPKQEPSNLTTIAIVVVMIALIVSLAAVLMRVLRKR